MLQRYLREASRCAPLCTLIRLVKRCLGSKTWDFHDTSSFAKARVSIAPRYRVVSLQGPNSRTVKRLFKNQQMWPWARDQSSTTTVAILLWPPCNSRNVPKPWSRRSSLCKPKSVDWLDRPVRKHIPCKYRPCPGSPRPSRLSKPSYRIASGLRFLVLCGDRLLCAWSYAYRLEATGPCMGSRWPTRNRSSFVSSTRMEVIVVNLQKQRKVGDPSPRK